MTPSKTSLQILSNVFLLGLAVTLRRTSSSIVGISSPSQADTSLDLIFVRSSDRISVVRQNSELVPDCIEDEIERKVESFVELILMKRLESVTEDPVGSKVLENKFLSTCKTRRLHCFRNFNCLLPDLQ